MTAGKAAKLITQLHEALNMERNERIRDREAYVAERADAARAREDAHMAADRARDARERVLRVIEDACHEFLSNPDTLDAGDLAVTVATLARLAKVAQ